MPSRKIRSRKKRSRVIKKQSGKSKKKSVNRLRVKLPQLFSKVSLDPPPIKPKKGKPRQVTTSSIKRKQKVNNILNEFIFSLNEPFTRGSFIDSLNVFRKNVVASNSKVPPSLRRNILTSLKSVEYTLSNLQESKLQEWLKEYQKDDKNKIRDISLVVKSLAQESLKDDTERLLSLALEISPELEGFSSLSKNQKTPILEIVSERMNELNKELSNPGYRKYLEFLEKNPSKAINIINWLEENFSDSSDVWDRISELMPLEDEDEDVIVVPTKIKTRPMKMIISLSALIGELQRVERMQRQGLIKSDTLAQIIEKSKEALKFVGGITLAETRAFVELNTKTNGELFKDINLLKRLTSGNLGHSLSHDKNSEEIVELRDKIIKLLNDNSIKQDIVLGEDPIISISVMPGGSDEYGGDDTPDVYTAIAVSEKEIKSVYPSVAINERKLGKISFKKTLKTTRDIEEIVLNDEDSADLIKKILNVVKGYVTTVMNKFLELPSFQDDMQVQIFSKWYKTVFINDLFRQIKVSSETMGDVLDRVSEFLIFFMIDSFGGMKKNIFVITNLTGSLNGRESGEYFRNMILQRRITPQSILEQTLKDKLPIVFAVQNFKGRLVENRVRNGINWLKDNLLQIILNSLDPTSKTIRKRSRPISDLPERVIDSSDNQLKTKKEFLASYGPQFSEQKKAMKIWNDSKKVIFEDLILHGSCEDKSQHSVLYLEEKQDSNTGKQIKILYCFDLSELYDKLTSNSGTFVNEFSGKPFSDEFRQMIQNITPGTIRNIKESNEFLSSLYKLQNNNRIKKIQRWFRRARSKKDLRFKNNGKWALTFLLDLRPVKDYIEENKPDVMEEDDEEDLDMDDLFGSDDSDEEDLDINEEDEDEDLFGSSNDDDEEDDEDKPHGTGAASPAESQDEASSDTSFSMNDNMCNVCNKPCKFGFASINDGVNGFKTVYFCMGEPCLASFSFNK